MDVRVEHRKAPVCYSIIDQSNGREIGLVPINAFMGKDTAERIASQLATALVAHDTELAIDPRVLFNAAEAHAADTGEDHEVGDLQDMLDVALSIMSDAQRRVFLNNERVRHVLDPFGDHSSGSAAYDAAAAQPGHEADPEQAPSP